MVKSRTKQEKSFQTKTILQRQTQWLNNSVSQDELIIQIGEAMSKQAAELSGSSPILPHCTPNSSPCISWLPFSPSVHFTSLKESDTWSA